MQDSSLKSQKLFEFKRRLVTSPAYYNSQPKPKSPNDLSDWDWVVLAPVQGKKIEFKKARKHEIVKKISSRISVNSAHALSQFARAGAGLAIVPEYFSEPHIATSELVYVLPEWTVDPISVYAVWPSNAPKDGLIKQLVKFLKARQNS